jgi:hypothetical protein
MRDLTRPVRPVPPVPLVPPDSKPAGQLAEFMERIKTQPHRGRLAFIIDATASREATWDLASQLQAEMFEAAAALGSLQLQLTFFRGSGNGAECKHSFGSVTVARWRGSWARFLVAVDIRKFRKRYGMLRASSAAANQCMRLYRRSVRRGPRGVARRGE